MSASQTTIVFVPGAWHAAKVFEPVARILEQAGYRTDLVDLPSVGPAEHLPNFDPDVAAIRRHVEAAIARGQRVVLVTHSYGGVPASEALRDLPTAPDPTPQSDGSNNDQHRHEGPGRAPGHVAHLIFCAAFIIAAGHSLATAFGDAWPLPWFRISADEQEVLPDDPARVFCGDLPREDPRVVAAVAGVRPHSFQPLHSCLTFEAWRHVPTTYLYTLRDDGLPPAVQKAMVEGTAGGVKIRTEELDSGHSPFVSCPEEMAGAVRRAAEL